MGTQVNVDNELTSHSEVLSAVNSQWKECRNRNGDTIVHLAACTGNLVMIKLVAESENRGLLSQKNIDGKTPLHIAVQSGQLECVKSLLSYGVDVNAIKRSDWTPLMLACTKQNVEVVKELILNGADINLVNKDGWTAFHVAIREGNVLIIKFLSEMDPSLSQTRSNNGRTPLHTACLHGHLEVVKMLIDDMKCDMNSTDSCGTTPLMDSVSGGHINVMEFLIKLGVNYKERDKLGRNLLHIAYEAESMQCLEHLLHNYDVPVDEQTVHGVTIAHLACKANDFGFVTALLQLNADFTIIDNRGRTALEYTSDKKIHLMLLLCNE